MRNALAKRQPAATFHISEAAEGWTFWTEKEGKIINQLFLTHAQMDRVVEVLRKILGVAIKLTPAMIAAYILFKK